MQAEERRALCESIVRHVRDIITVVDGEGVVRYVNEAPTEALGHRPEEAPGKASLSWVHPDDQAMCLDRRSWLLGGPDRTTVTVMRVRQGDGSWRHVETHGVNLLADPDVRGLLYVTRDVEDRARAELSLVHALRAQSVVAELGQKALQCEDVDLVLHEGLQRTAALLGTPSVTLLLQEADERLRVRLQVGPDALPPGHPWPARSQAGHALDRRHPVIAEHLASEERFARTPEQVERGLVAGVAVLLEGVHGPIGVLEAHSTKERLFSPVDVQLLQGVANVLAGALERADRERRAVVQALHDPLTGLPTRTLFDDRLEHGLSRIRRTGGEVAVLLIDLDRFKAVNDSWGHAAGDEVLRALGPRLKACARASDTVARYGGDEFVVLCEEDVTHVGVSRVAAKIRRACAEPVALSTGETVMVSASIGRSWSVEEGADGAALLAAADASMYQDKRHGLRTESA